MNTFHHRQQIASTDRRPRQAAVATEFAVTLPILIVFVFGAIEFGMANMMIHTAEAAAYEAARVGMTPGATATEVIQTANDILATARISHSTVAVTPTDLSTDSSAVRVSVTFKFADNTVFAPYYMSSGDLVRTCELRREKID